jgi:hypothetical protein
VKQWFHVVATYSQDSQSCTFLNGRPGGCVRARNGKHPSRKEKLILGGRGPNDGRHNPSVKVTSAQVYKGKLLTRSEVTSLYSSFTPPSPPGCKRFKTANNQRYNAQSQWITLGKSKSVTFDVKAKNDAHIGFFSSKKSTGEVYEVVLSGWGNRQSVIRETAGGANRVVKSTVGLLNGNQFRPFWSDVNNGLVRVGKGKTVGRNVLMQWKDPNPHKVMYVGLKTGWGATGEWSVCGGTGVGVGVPPPPPVSTPVRTRCASENQNCACTGRVRYGHHNHRGQGAKWSGWKTSSTGSIRCTNGVFGDPAPGTVKYCECEKAAAAPGTCKNLKVGNFGDWRSGNQYQNNARNLGTVPRATAAQTLTFKYKYVLGYCPGKGKGNGPTLTVKVAGKTVWTKTIDVRTADYPYDRGCGGAPNKYSPTQTASFTAPAAGGAARLELTVRNRNIHVVGMGMCAAAGGPAAKKCANENQNCACTGQVRYGHHNHKGQGQVWSQWKSSTGSIRCTNGVFGDPAPGTVKYCECKAGGTGSGKRCAADVEYKLFPGVINVEDLLLVLGHYDKKCPQQVSCEMDVNNKGSSKGVINVEDLLGVLAMYGKKC